jgi:hypothetical protein
VPAAFQRQPSTSSDSCNRALFDPTVDAAPASERPGPPPSEYHSKPTGCQQHHRPSFSTFLAMSEFLNEKLIAFSADKKIKTSLWHLFRPYFVSGGPSGLPTAKQRLATVQVLSHINSAWDSAPAIDRAKLLSSLSWTPYARLLSLSRPTTCTSCTCQSHQRLSVASALSLWQHSSVRFPLC